MSPQAAAPLDRFLYTLHIVAREAGHLRYSWGRLFAEPIDVAWVHGLEREPERAERLEAFVSRYGRMQDTIAARLLPRWLVALAETPGSQIEVLQRAERLGVLASAERWLEARQLRNRLVHEYMTDPEQFAADLSLARGYTRDLFDTFHRVCGFARHRMGVAPQRLPPRVELSAGS